MGHRYDPYANCRLVTAMKQTNCGPQNRTASFSLQTTCFLETCSTRKFVQFAALDLRRVGGQGCIRREGTSEAASEALR